MPEYLAPGVYVEEINTGPRPIEGVSTSTAGFVGETERGATKPTLVTSWSDFLRVYGGYINQPPRNAKNCYLPYAVRGFFDNGGQRLYVARVAGPGSVPSQLQLPGGGAATVIEASGQGSWGNGIRIAVRQASASKAQPAGSTSPAASWFRIIVLYYRNAPPAPFIDPTDPSKLSEKNRRTPDAFEDFDNLSDDRTSANYAKTVINNASQLIKVVNDLTGPPNPIEFEPGTMTGGVSVDADLNAYVGDAQDPEDRTGLEGLLTIRDISIMSAPDDIVVDDLADKLLDRCEGAKDRFAVLNELSNGVAFQTMVHRDSSYGGLYYPRIRVVASHTPEGYVLVPPSGHVVGIYARTDVERGVHKAPANEVVRGIVSRDLNGGRKPLAHTLSKREHDVLNPKGFNVIRDFRTDQRDIRVWGARTMTSDAMWKYINVRRLFIFIEQSIDRGTQWAVFEPNGIETWSAIRTSITNFLRTVWRSGALMGATPEEAFFVKCDRHTMTQDDFDNGRLICEIGVAPVKPAEFVIFRISQKTLDSEA